MLNHPSAALLRLPPVDALTLAWVMARRCDELDAWRALYEALHPAPAAVGQAQEASTP